MTQPQIELKACPFCGSDRLEVDVRYVSCKSCGADGPYNEGDSIQNSIDLWHTASRSIPQVAPGLRDAIRDAMLKQLPRDPVKTPDWNALLTNDRLNDLADAVAIAIAAQGGQVDSLRDFDQWMEQVYLDYNKAAAYGECDAVRYVADEFRKRLAAVPSAPGAERVKAALIAYTDPLDSDEYYAPLFTELRESITALGAPQGSDSQRLDAIIEQGFTVEFDMSSGQYYLSRNGQRGHLRPTPREAIDDWIQKRAAQPVAAGEAKERGE